MSVQIKFTAPCSSSGCNCGPSCNQSICVVDCTGAAVAGATVQINAPGGVVTGTTNSLGCVAVGVGVAGTFTTTVTKTGFQTFTGPVAYTCPGAVNLTLLNTGATPCQITVVGCHGCPLIGATVTINGQTLTTNSSGQVSFVLAQAGTYPYTVTASRFTPFSGNLTVTSVCSGCTATATPTVASGFVCPTSLVGACSSCFSGYPWPTTLFLTDPFWGLVTLTYNGTNWSGSLAINFTAFCGCPAFPGAIISYVFDCITLVTVDYMTNAGPGVSAGCPGPFASLATFPTSGLPPTTIPVSGSYSFAGCVCVGGGCSGSGGGFVYRPWPTPNSFTISE